ncbi:MAG: hypothetical protein FWG87_14045 [Defluviitaleaceae bacterium]|nr:hypothetical protein [Defluviitaleaceae bacterium]
MRRTSAYHFAAITAVLVILFLGATFDSATLAIILGIVAVIVVYKIVVSIEDGLDRGINKLIHGGSQALVEDMLNTVIVFETSADKDATVSHFCNIYPRERSKGDLKQDWICNHLLDDKGDDLFFVIGVSAFCYVSEAAGVPITGAKLCFDKTPEGSTTAVFSFNLRIFPHNSTLFGAIPHTKNMAELMGAVKDSFMSLDSDCKITENKGVCV